MGIPAWLWFVIAVLALIGGAYLLLRDRMGGGGNVDRERKRWASLRGWQYVEEDERLLDQWRGGSLAYFGGQYAVDVVAGSTFTSSGRRPVFVFDQETDNQVDATVAAVRCRRQAAALVELWLPNVPFQRDQMPDLLGPVGQRYAFVSDVNAARAVITRDLVDAVDGLGEDVTVVWLEDEWVLAALPPESTPARLERLLRDLGEIADLIDPVEPAGEEAANHAAGNEAQPPDTYRQTAPQTTETASRDPQTPARGIPADPAETPQASQKSQAPQAPQAQQNPQTPQPPQPPQPPPPRAATEDAEQQRGGNGDSAPQRQG